MKVVEDRAAKNFRSAVREKIEYKEQHQSSAFAYITSAVLVLIVLVIGITTVNNFDKMKAVQNSLETLSETVGGGQADAKTRTETAETAKNNAKEASGTVKKAEGRTTLRNIGRTTLRSGFLCSTERRNAGGNQSEIIWRYVTCKGNLQNEWAV